MSKKKDSLVLKLDKIPKGSRLERYLKQLPEVMKDHKVLGLFMWKVFSECSEFLSQNYDTIKLPQFTLKIVPTHERFKLEEQRESEGAISKEVAKARVCAFVVHNKHRARVYIDLECFIEALSVGGYPTFILFLVETFLQEILHTIFPQKYEQEIWNLQCGFVESFLGIKLSEKRKKLKASDYYTKEG